MTQDELLRVIEQAANEGATELDLSGNELVELPPEIGSLTKLETLILGSLFKGNKLKALPAEIGQLQNLSVLDLSANQLDSLPTEIGQLQNLSRLNLGANQLSSLPAEISQLQELSVLDLSANQLSSLPAEIVQLQKLSVLDLSETQLSSLPAEIGQLQNLFRLNLSETQLSSLPAEIGQLQNLSVLDLSKTQLSNLPAEIGQLQNLSELDLSKTQLGNLPTEIGQLKDLSKLDLRKNPLPIPPEILEKAFDPATIINYYLQNCAKRSRLLNEAKMLLVGEAKVGKTSLVKRLIDNTFDANERITEGINITEWPIKANNQTVKLNIWDFGGQEIMHATHQFFLTKRSLYLLVLNARQDETANRIEYWLKIIRSFGGDSPIIVVGNQVDQKPLDIDRRGLKNKYPNIVGFIETSCSDFAHRGIKQLERKIQQQIADLPHVFDTLPHSWFSVKTQLEQLDVDYIEYHQYQQICASQKVNDDQSQKILISFLHDLGIVLNFRDDPRLQQDSVLNPQWVTDGVYSILNDNALMTQHKGILRRSMLRRILDAHRYPIEKHLFILNIMRKFELCFPLEGYEDDHRYLLPDLLSKEESETGNWEEALPFQYHYNILPSSIISRFIVRMNHLISKRTYWRNGVVLVRGGTKALVKADKEDRKIFVWVKSPPKGTLIDRRILLESIRDQFDYIHCSIPGIEVEEKVPLPSNPNVLVDYTHLLDMEAEGIQEFMPSGTRKMVRVEDLLTGIETPQGREERLEIRKGERLLVPPRISRPNSPRGTTNGWPSRFFDLFMLAAIVAILTVVSGFVKSPILPFIIIGTLLIFGFIRISQFMQEDKISSKDFVELITQILERMPLLKGQSKTNHSLDTSNDED